MTAGISGAGASAFGLCVTCGAEIGAGEPHADSCEEDAFVNADAEHQRLQGAEDDARDAYSYVSKYSRRGKKVAIARSKLDRCERLRRNHEAELRWRFQHQLNIVEAGIVLRWLERAAAAIERQPNEESTDPTHIGESHYFTRAMALKQAAAAVRALKPKED